MSAPTNEYRHQVLQRAVKSRDNREKQKLREQEGVGMMATEGENGTGKGEEFECCGNRDTQARKFSQRPVFYSNHLVCMNV